jgi:hypothetical protein
VILRRVRVSGRDVWPSPPPPISTTRSTVPHVIDFAGIPIDAGDEVLVAATRNDIRPDPSSREGIPDWQTTIRLGSLKPPRPDTPEILMLTHSPSRIYRGRCGPPSRQSRCRPAAAALEFATESHNRVVLACLLIEQTTERARYTISPSLIQERLRLLHRLVTWYSQKSVTKRRVAATLQSVPQRFLGRGLDDDQQ